MTTESFADVPFYESLYYLPGAKYEYKGMEWVVFHVMAIHGTARVRLFLKREVSNDE